MSEFFASTKRNMDEYEKRIIEIDNGKEKTPEDREFILYINMTLAKSLIEDLGGNNAIELAKLILVNQGERLCINHIEKDWRNDAYRKY